MLWHLIYMDILLFFSSIVFLVLALSALRLMVSAGFDFVFSTMESLLEYAWVLCVRKWKRYNSMYGIDSCLQVGGFLSNIKRKLKDFSEKNHKVDICSIWYLSYSMAPDYERSNDCTFLHCDSFSSFKKFFELIYFFA